MQPARSRSLCFGVFELDLHAGELRKQGVKIKLQEQPFQILQVLLENPGELISREELQRRIWPADTFVDFDHGLYNAIKRLREALGDSAEKPRYIETLARRGYRFIGPVKADRHASAIPASHANDVSFPNSPIKGNPALTIPPSDTAPKTAAAALVPRGPIPLPDPAARSDETVRPTPHSVSSRVLAGCVGLMLVLTLLAAMPAVRARLLGPPASPAIHSLAVLPLQNLSGDPGQEYFADGMTEELITELSQLSGLRVISRTSVMRYKKTDKSLPQIARELGVDAIVEGSVLRSGDRVRITAQLIHAAKDTNLWAQSYDRNLQDVLGLQSTVAGAIAREIKVNTTPGETARLKTARTVNPKALDAYLEGQYRIHKAGNGDEECRKAFACFERALAEDPRFARAYTAIADAYNALMVRPANVWELQQSAAEKALAIDPDSADAHVILGVIKANRDWDWVAAETEYRKAIELDPNNADAHDNLGMLLDWMNRPDEALRELELAQALDPAKRDYLFDFVRSTSFKRKYHDDQQHQAIERLRNIARYDADDAFMALTLYELYADNDMDDSAMEQLQRAASLYGYKELAARIRQVHGSAGAKEAAKVYAAEIERANQSGELWRPVMVAEAYARAGNKEKAWQWLQKSYELRDFQLLCVFPDANNKLGKMFRSDPRYVDMVRRIGLPQ